MTDISFYHLLHQPLTSALPKLLDKVHGAGMKAVIRVGSEERMMELDEVLWTFKPDSFLPHGDMKCKYPDQQVIYLTTEEENPAGASVLVLVDSMESALIADYDRCLEMFDGRNDEATAAARARWKAYKEAGHTLTYWQQTEQGGWSKKA
ncbi:DNA polymerase III subunit chi [Paremcibacter congregatus]|uniref:DNA polymerase III subunit chi n=1 Tax=Paremcibacter congregatus TaxID=2043170 RepID=UPI0030EC0D46|tara:strand:+ start:4541 stop:4990 length:450 start_codon:yes stop_codon:yes gene_type:complete